MMQGRDSSLGSITPSGKESITVASVITKTLELSLCISFETDFQVARVCKLAEEAK